VKVFIIALLLFATSAQAESITEWAKARAKHMTSGEQGIFDQAVDEARRERHSYGFDDKDPYDSAKDTAMRIYRRKIKKLQWNNQVGNWLQSREEERQESKCWFCW
jgi:hypothetical protein